MIRFCTLKMYLIFRAAGVTEVELASVIAMEVNRVVAAGWRDKEASGSIGEILVIKRIDFRQGVGPLCPVSRHALIVA